MDELFIFTSVAFFIWALRSIFYWVSQWQQLSSGRLFIKSPFAYALRIIFAPLSILSWVGVVFAFYVTVSDLPLSYYEYFIFIIFVLKAIITLTEISSDKLQLPRFTTQNIIVSGLAVFLTSLVVALPLTERYLWLLLVDRLLFICVAIPVFLILFPSEIFDDLQLRRATQLVKKLKKVQTVFIIGENASETAYFMRQLMKKRKNVLVIENLFLRPSFVAKTILKKASSQTDFIFVVIPQLHSSSLLTIAEVIQPKFIVVTTTSAKVVSQAIKRLTPILTKHTKLLINQEMAKVVKVKKGTVSTFDMTSSSIRQRKDEMQVGFINKNGELLLNFPLIGRQHVLYLLPVLYFAQLSGMSDEELITSARSVSPMPGRMVMHILHSGVGIIDATKIIYKDEVAGALDYLRLYHNEKVVIFGIDDELSQDEIKSLKPHFASPTKVMILNQKHQQLMRRLIRLGTGGTEVSYMKGAEALDLISDRLIKGDVVLLLGKKASELVETVLLSSGTTR